MAARRSHPIPPRAHPLVGRDPELAALRGFLGRGGPRLVTVTGPGGVGKTRLVVELAWIERGRSRQVRYVDLSALRDPDLVLPAIGAAMGVSEGRRATLIDRIARTAPPRTLLVLDNVEQVAGAAAELGTLIAQAPGLRVVVTSRVPLHLTWEQELRIAPLAVPSDLAGALPPVDSPAVQLFVERARSVVPGLELTDEDLAAVSRLCRHLDGLPLAIELAAARARALPLGVLVDHLDPGLDLLNQRAPDVPERHATLRDTMAWSHELLGADQQRLFRRLAVFAGGCTPDGALAVAAPGPEAAAWMTSPPATAGRTGPHDPERSVPPLFLDALASLVEKSLLEVAPGPRREARFVLLETVRAFAQELLEEAGETTPTRDRHLAYYAELARSAEPELEGGALQAEWLGRLEAELDNLRQALAWARDTRAWELGLRMAADLCWFWFVRGHDAEGRRWLTDLLRAPTERVSTETPVVGLRALAWLEMEQGEYNGRAAREALRLARRLDDPRQIGRALTIVGLIDRAHGHWAHARERHAEALALLTGAGDRVNAARNLTYLAWVALDVGRTTEAVRIGREGVDRFAALRYPGGQSYALGFLAYAMVRRDPRAARAVAEEAYRLASALDYGWSEGFARLTLARIAEHEGDLVGAADHLRRSLLLLSERGEPVQAWLALDGLARVASASRAAEPAAWFLGAADEMRRQMGLVAGAHEQAERERLLTTLRRVLGKDLDGALLVGAGMEARELLAIEVPGSRRADQHPARRAAGVGRSATPRVSPREREVADLIADGCANREIALQLGITEATVESHVQHILNKLGFHSRSQIAAWIAVEPGGG